MIIRNLIGPPRVLRPLSSTQFWATPHKHWKRRQRRKIKDKADFQYTITSWLVLLRPEKALVWSNKGITATSCGSISCWSRCFERVTTAWLDKLLSTLHHLFITISSRLQGQCYQDYCPSSQISFTTELEKDGKLPFLDVEISRSNGKFFFFVCLS